jgi:hypothetical protein
MGMFAFSAMKAPMDTTDAVMRFEIDHDILERFT